MYQRKEHILPLADVANILNVNPVKAQRLIRQGQLQPVRTTSGIGYRAEDVRALQGSVNKARKR